MQQKAPVVLTLGLSCALQFFIFLLYAALPSMNKGKEVKIEWGNCVVHA
jgi:hypothetical protein